MTEYTIDRPSAARRSVCAALVSLPAVSLAQLRVEITGVGSQQFPIAIAPFARDGQVPVEIESVVRADLARSGLFRIVDAGAARRSPRTPPSRCRTGRRAAPMRSRSAA